MLRKTSSKGTLEFDLPNGVILRVSDENKILLEAIEVNQVNTLINLNYSFEIKQ